MSGTKTKAVDADIDEHYLSIESLTIDPPLPSSAGLNAANLKVRENKNEDVVWNPQTNSVEVIAMNVTEVTVDGDWTSSYAHDYPILKRQIKAIAKAAKDAGCKMNGAVIVRDANRNTLIRLLVRDNVVSIQEAVMAWPDGTTIALANGHNLEPA